MADQQPPQRIGGNLQTVQAINLGGSLALPPATTEPVLSPSFVGGQGSGGGGSTTILARLTPLQTSNYNAVIGDGLVQCDPSGGSFNVNLPPNAQFGTQITIANITGSINTVGVVPTSGQSLATPDGTLTLAAFDSATLTFNGSTWIVS